MAEQDQAQPYPGTTLIKEGRAYDISGKDLGGVDDEGKPTGGTGAKPTDLSTPQGVQAAVKSAPRAAAPPEDEFSSYVDQASAPQDEFSSYVQAATPGAGDEFSTYVHKAQQDRIDNFAPKYLRDDPKFQAMSHEEKAAVLARHFRATSPEALAQRSDDRAAGRVLTQDKIADYFEDVGEGAKTSLMQNAKTIGGAASNALRKVGAHHVADIFSNEKGTGITDALDTERHGTYASAEALGMASENILEFVSGDELLKVFGSGFMALKSVSKSAALAKIMEWGVKNPVKFKSLAAIATGLRQGAVSGAQTLGHGGSLGEAVENALTTAALGTTFHAFGEMGQAGNPLVKIAGKLGTIATSSTMAAHGLDQVFTPQGKDESDEQYNDRIMNGAVNVVMSVGAAEPELRDAIKNGPAAVKRTLAYITTGEVIGKATSFDQAIERTIGRIGKADSQEVQRRVKNASQDLQSIVKADTQNKISGPHAAGEFANAIDQHIESKIAGPITAEIEKFRDSREPVVAKFGERLEERIQQFVADNQGRMTQDEIEGFAQTVRELAEKQVDLGNGTMAARDPNLFEADNMRKRMGEEKGKGGTGEKFFQDMEDFMRETIDEGLGLRGVEGIKEARSRQADLIDVRDWMRKAQDIADKQNLGKRIWDLFGYGKIVGMIGTLGAGLLSGDLGVLVGAGVVGKTIQDFNIKSVKGNIATAKKLASQTAQPTVPQPGGEATVLPGPHGPAFAPAGFYPQQAEFGPEPPPTGPAAGAPGGPGGTPPAAPPVAPAAPAAPTAPAPAGEAAPVPASETLPPGFPAKPQSPEPVKRPDINHKSHGLLATLFRGDLKGGAEGFRNLRAEFDKRYQAISAFAEAKANGTLEAYRKQTPKPPEFSDETVEKYDRVHAKLMENEARDYEEMAKQNAANQKKYDSDVRKWQEKLAVEREKQAKQVEADRKQMLVEAELRKDERQAALEADERIAHGGVMKALDKPKPIEVTSGSHTSEEAHGHENGHILAWAAEGLQPVTFWSNEHPEMKESHPNAAALVRADVSEATGPGGELTPEGLVKISVGLLGGAAWDEVHSDMKLGRNSGAQSDVRQVRKLLRDFGLSGNALEIVFDKIYDRALMHVSNPDLVSLAKANMAVRESGLEPTHHMSDSRMRVYVDKIQKAAKQGALDYEQTGNARAIGERAAAARGPRAVGAGTEGTEQAGIAKDVRAETVPEGAKGDEGEGRGGPKGRELPTSRRGGPKGPASAAISGAARPAIEHRVTEKGGELRIDRDGKNQGLMKYTMNADGTASVTAVNLDKNLRGRGLGLEMYERAAEAAKERGATALTSDLAGQTSYDAAQTWERLMRAYPGEIERVQSKAGSPGYRWDLSPRVVEAALDIPVPKERTTGIDEIDKTIREGGGIPGGTQKGFEYTKKDGTKVSQPDYAFFHDPQTGTSLMLPHEDVTSEAVKARIEESRKKYGISPKAEGTEQGKPHATLGIPGIGGDKPEGSPTLSSKIVSAAVDAEPEWKQRVEKEPFKVQKATDYRQMTLHNEKGTEIGRIAHDGKPGDEEARIRVSFLNPDMQNQGIGKEMYKAAIRDAQAMGIHFLNSDTSVSKQAGQVWEALRREGLPIVRKYTGLRPGNVPPEEGGHAGWEYSLDLTKLEPPTGDAAHSGRAADFVEPSYLPQGEAEDQGLYHVTTALDRVISQGLKSRRQLRAEGSPTTIGLGGGFGDVASDKVSATYDAGHAALIEDRMKLAVRAARGELSPSDAIGELINQAGLDDDTPEMIANALPVELPKKAYEDWDAFNKAVDDRYGVSSAYDAVQDLDDALPGLFSDDVESPVRVGFTATRLQMAKIDPNQIGTVRVEGRRGATVDHQPQEAELRFHPNDIRVAQDEISSHLAGRYEGYTPEESKSILQVDIKFPVVQPGDQIGSNEVSGESVPNMDSIGASLAPNYKVLDGIRRINMSDFPDLPAISKEAPSYSREENDRIKNLAGEINKNREITPLIVGYDNKGPYILEGAHRFDALRLLDETSFPAIVAVDLNEGYAPGTERPKPKRTVEAEITSEPQTAPKQAASKRAPVAGIPQQKDWDDYGPKAAPGLVERGNIKLTGRPIIVNDDGSHSSEYSMSFEENGKEVLIPTIANGKFFTPDGKFPKTDTEEKEMNRRAIEYYHKTGEHMGKFDTPAHADAYAEAVHSRKQ